MLANVADWRSLDRAEAVVIAIGTNDVWQWRAEGLEQRVAAIVRRIEAPTLLLGLSAKLRGIDAANAALRRACTGRCRFIEPIDDHGPDGIHLSQRGYQALAKRLALPVSRPRRADRVHNAHVSGQTGSLRKRRRSRGPQRRFHAHRLARSRRPRGSWRARCCVRHSCKGYLGQPAPTFQRHWHRPKRRRLRR